MYSCDACEITACCREDRERVPANCPMGEKELNRDILERYSLPCNKDFYICSSGIEAEGYGRWTRLEEILQFCKHMGFQKVGLAFCSGLRQEGRIIGRILRAHGLEVESVICKTGGISKERAGIPEQSKLRPGHFEAMCNPIAQAELLNKAGTQFNIVVGLCVGHDSLFYKYAQGLTTTLITKDRVLAHNPAGAVYCADGYYKSKLAP